MVCTFLNARYLLALGYLGFLREKQDPGPALEVAESSGEDGDHTRRQGSETPFTLGTEEGGGEGKRFTGNLILKLALGR